MIEPASWQRCSGYLSQRSKVFQGSLLVGFLQAASRLVDASDFDIWITARGVQAFEFGAPVESRVREMAAGVPGVVETGRRALHFPSTESRLLSAHFLHQARWPHVSPMFIDVVQTSLATVAWMSNAPPTRHIDE
jgi:hypothetical protein